MEIKATLSLIATVIAVVSYVPYIRDIRRGKTKPHAFSWLIWALLTYIAGAAQLQAGGGIGATVAFVTATISLYIALISYRDGSVQITKGDWMSLVVAILAIPAWLVTKEPLLSVIIVSVIDLLGFWPTFRKSFRAPQEETLSTYSLSTLKHCLTVLAQEKYNWTTVLYPASLAITTAALVAMIVVRKRTIKT